MGIKLESKFSNSDVTIFTKMSSLAREYNAVNLGQGFPNFDCDAALRELVSKHLNDKKNQYAPMAGVLSLRESIAHKVQNTYNERLDPEKEITITAGATQALYCAITAIVGECDEVLMIDPCYDSYKPTVELNKGIPVVYELKAPHFRVNWDSFAELITPKTKMLIINNPHNPLGVTFSKSDLDRLAEIVRDTNIVVLSDEVYEHLVFDNKTHNSVLNHPELKERSFACYSFGKTFHITGWKIGYCIAPESLMKEFRNVHQWNVFSVNSFSQYALAEYLEDPNHYLSLPAFYQKKRDVFQDEMQSSKFKALNSEGSYFQIYDYSAISDLPDTAFAEKLVEEYGVAGIPISVFYSSKRQDRCIRFCFAKTEDKLLEAASLLKAVDSI